MPPRKTTMQTQLVAGRADAAIEEVVVPRSVEGNWESEAILAIARSAVKQGGFTDGADPIQKFAETHAKIYGTDNDTALAVIVDKLTTSDPITGEDVYGDEHRIMGPRGKLMVTHRDDLGNATKAKARSVKITPLGKIHLLSSGDTELARDLRDYMINCTKRLKDLEAKAATYEAEHLQEAQESIDTRDEITAVLMSKGMEAKDAMSITLLVDKLATLPLLFGNGKHVSGNGLHHGNPAVKNGTTAVKTVKAIPGTVCRGGRGNVSAGLNKTGRGDQKQTRRYICNMYSRVNGNITKPHAINLLKRFADVNKNSQLELDPNSDGFLSATDQARAKLDAAEDMQVTDLVTLPPGIATPVWRIQNGLS